MIREEKIRELLEELNIPPGTIQRFEDVAQMAGILSSELLVRLILRLYDDSESVMRDLIDPTYGWDEKEG